MKTDKRYAVPKFREIATMRVTDTKEIVISKIEGTDDYAIVQRIEEDDKNNPGTKTKIYLHGRFTINGSKLKNFINMVEAAYETDYLD